MRYLLFFIDMFHVPGVFWSPCAPPLRPPPSWQSILRQNRTMLRSPRTYDHLQTFCAKSIFFIRNPEEWASTRCMVSVVLPSRLPYQRARRTCADYRFNTTKCVTFPCVFSLPPHSLLSSLNVLEPPWSTGRKMLNPVFTSEVNLSFLFPSMKSGVEEFFARVDSTQGRIHDLQEGSFFLLSGCTSALCPSLPPVSAFSQD